MDIYVQHLGQKLGPFSEAKIRESIDAGEFAPSDLAWIAGRASWQHLSALIDLDTTKPPPFNAGANKIKSTSKSGKASTSAPAPARKTNHGGFKEGDDPDGGTSTDVVGLMPGEVIVYQDDPMYCQILVTNLRVKIKGSTYSLAGISEAKCDIRLTTKEGYTGFKRFAWWAAFWLYSAFTVYSIFSASFEWGVLVGPPLIFYFANKANRDALWYYYSAVTVSLIKNWEPTICYRKQCPLRPSQLGSISEEERRVAQQRFDEEMNEPAVLTDAINKAITLKTRSA